MPPSRNTSPQSRQPSRGPGAKPTCLGLTPSEIVDVLDRLDAPSGPHTSRRQTRRLAYRHWPVAMVFFPAQGSKTAVAVITRNISRGGISFLHGSYVHTGLAVVAVLRNQRGIDVQIPGRVARCRHVERHLHEVGIRFNTPIDVHDYLPVDHVGAQFSLEVTDPGMLRGRLLLVADYDIDRTLILHLLEGTQLQITPAASIEEAVAAADKTIFDVVMSDYDLGKGTGIDLYNALRAKGASAPVIIMSSDVSGATRTRVREAKCDAFLNKPFTRDLVLSALAEFLLLGSLNPSECGAMSSSLPPDSPLMPLVSKFVAETKDVAASLETYLRDDKKDEFIRAATRLAGTASTLGFASLSKAAESAIRAINSTGSMKEAGEGAAALISACRRVEGISRAA